MSRIRAIIADDEKPLRDSLKAKLNNLWPQLKIYSEAENGIKALELINKIKPEIAFLDIRMPGLSGIEVAGKVSDICHIVFITAYDQYAIEAFENAAVDYILKPVTEERLIKSINRLKKQIDTDNESQQNISTVMQQLMSTLDKKDDTYLKWIRVQHGNGVRLIPVDEISYFKAEDKYTVVVTHEGEWLIKKGIMQLTKELDSTMFWRIHRGTIVNVQHILKVNRSVTGRLILKLKDLPEILNVSRTYSHLFKQM